MAASINNIGLREFVVPVEFSKLGALHPSLDPRRSSQVQKKGLVTPALAQYILSFIPKLQQHSSLSVLITMRARAEVTFISDGARAASVEALRRSLMFSPRFARDVATAGDPGQRGWKHGTRNMTNGWRMRLLVRANCPATLLSAAAAADTTWCIRDGCYGYVILLKIKLLFSAKNQPRQVKVKMLVLIFLRGSGKISSLNNFKTQPQAGSRACSEIHYFVSIRLSGVLKLVHLTCRKSVLQRPPHKCTLLDRPLWKKKEKPSPWINLKRNHKKQATDQF